LREKETAKLFFEINKNTNSKEVPGSCEELVIEWTNNTDIDINLAFSFNTQVVVGGWVG